MSEWEVILADDFVEPGDPIVPDANPRTGLLLQRIINNEVPLLYITQVFRQQLERFCGVI